MIKAFANMLSWFDRPPTLGEERYRQAMTESDELLEKISKDSDKPARQMVADIWTNRKNIPYVTSAYETLQEMNSPLKQRRS